MLDDGKLLQRVVGQRLRQQVDARHPGRRPGHPAQQCGCDQHARTQAVDLRDLTDEMEAPQRGQEAVEGRWGGDRHHDTALGFRRDNNQDSQLKTHSAWIFSLTRKPTDMGARPAIKGSDD
jgi:hypothetical protein